MDTTLKPRTSHEIQEGSTATNDYTELSGEIGDSYEQSEKDILTDFIETEMNVQIDVAEEVIRAAGIEDGYSINAVFNALDVDGDGDIDVDDHYELIRQKYVEISEDDDDAELAVLKLAIGDDLQEEDLPALAAFYQVKYRDEIPAAPNLSYDAALIMVNELWDQEILSNDMDPEQVLNALNEHSAIMLHYDLFSQY